MRWPNCITPEVGKPKVVEIAEARMLKCRCLRGCMTSDCEVIVLSDMPLKQKTKTVTDIGFIGLRRAGVRQTRQFSGRKVMKPGSELNPRVWQGDCFMGIDQNRSEMFQNWKAGGPVLGTVWVHCLDDIARHRLPTHPRFSAAANRYHGGRAIALTNGDGQGSFIPRSGLVH